MSTFVIRHETVYRYGAPVAFGEHRLMLWPRDGRDQRTLTHRLEIEPEPKSLHWAEDASGNVAGVATFNRRGVRLKIVAHMSVERDVFVEGTVPVAEHARACPFSYGTEETPELARFIERQHPDPDHALDRWARAILAEDPDRDTWGFLVRMTAAIRRDFAYLRREEPGVQSPATTLRTGRGSCRDFAVLMGEAVRTQGLASRFASGYLHVRGGDDRVRRAGGSTHAWLQVYVPGGGWIDFDPTSGAVGNRDLVRVALVRDPSRASPVAGTFMGFPSDDAGMSVDVDVRLASRDSAVAA